MKLLILSATGGIGLEIVRQAIDRGHEVTAFARTPERLKEFGERIAVIQGDVLNSAELERALEGKDSVLSGFGAREPRSKADADLRPRFAVALTRAMLHAKIRRVVVVSVAFLFKDSIFPPTYLFGRLFFRDVVIDASAMEDVFGKSELDWTIVRHPNLQTSHARDNIECERATASFWFHYFARGRRRLFHQDRRRSHLRWENLSGKQLTP